MRAKHARPVLTLDLDGPSTRLVDALRVHTGQSEEILEVPISQLKINPNNPPSRTEDGEELDSLASSISEIGIIQPLIVTTYGDGWMILAGNRRYAAARIAGLRTVPIVIRDDLQDCIDEVMLAENGSRLELTPLQEAESYRRLIDNGFSQARTAKVAGKSQGHVSQRLALLDLPDPVKDLIRAGTISAWDAYQTREAPVDVLMQAAELPIPRSMSWKDQVGLIVQSQRAAIRQLETLQPTHRMNPAEPPLTKDEERSGTTRSTPPVLTVFPDPRTGERRSESIDHPTQDQWAAVMAAFILGGSQVTEKLRTEVPTDGITQQQACWLFAAAEARLGSNRLLAAEYQRIIEQLQEEK